MLPAFGSKTQAGTKKRYGTLGNSFVAVVEFGPQINAHSIVTGGSSGLGKATILKFASEGAIIINWDLNVERGKALLDELKKMGIDNPSILDISNAVVAIRSSKLPDPKQIGNAGSFFKNPVVETDLLEAIKVNHPDIPSYPAELGKVKLAAGWLIEQAGWKGFTEKTYGVHKLQALVLVNYGGSTGQEIYDLSTQILEDVHQKFGVLLEREVNIL